MAKRKHRSCTARLLPALFLLIAAFFIGGAFLLTDYKQILLRSWGLPVEVQKSVLCENEGKPHGSETLPKGIISATSDLEMRSLWGNTDKDYKSNTAKNLLAMAVGIKQIKSVDQIVQKFPSGEFVVMLFHYDGNVDEWKGLDWSNRAIHISAINQTKWWFAKRFLHPDIISEYAYIFLWDEDLGVDNFDAGRYLSIVRAEGLEISQPALDPEKSDVHHHLTQRNTKSRVNRRTHKKIGSKTCDNNSTGPPCTGFVEMMAPVFSKASWRCVWHMFQNDLVLGWGVDFQLGYCAQGDRTKNIGIVDSEYIVHEGLPTLGGSASDKVRKILICISVQKRLTTCISYLIFHNRWKNAAKKDSCWIDPYQQ
ncbi:hypothetical protein LINPERPRIM_LOCUS40624 [Linum perenne]